MRVLRTKYHFTWGFNDGAHDYEVLTLVDDQDKCREKGHFLHGNMGKIIYLGDLNVFIEENVESNDVWQKLCVDDCFISQTFH